jgi:hypothetical protein
MAFESLDFCYDLVDHLDESKNLHISIFLQRENKVNKASVFHSNVKVLPIELLKSVLEIAINSMKVGQIKTRRKKLKGLQSHIQEQNIEYLVLIIDLKTENLEISYSIKDEGSIEYFIQGLRALYTKIKRGHKK